MKPVTEFRMPKVAEHFYQRKPGERPVPAIYATMSWKTKPRQNVLTNRKGKSLSKDELVNITIRTINDSLKIVFLGLICCFEEL